MLSKINNKAGFIVAFLILGLAFLLSYNNSYTAGDLCQKAQKNLLPKEQLALDRLQLMSQMLKENSPSQMFELFEGSITELADKENISLYAFINDSLKFWTTNRVPLDLSAKEIADANGMLHLRNGWYEYFSEVENNTRTLALILIKPEFDVQNNYLNNSFSKWLQIPEQAKLDHPVIDEQRAVHSLKGKALFGISEKQGEAVVKSKTLSSLTVILFFIALAIALFSIIKNALSTTVTFRQFLAGSIMLFLFRTATIYFKWPGFLYHINLFDLATYGNGDSFFNFYLGDILLNVILMFVWAFVFYKKVESGLWPERMKLLSLTVLLFILSFLAFELNVIIKSLIENSTISFDFMNFFNLDVLSFLCLAIVFVYGFSLATILEKWMLIFSQTTSAKKNFVLAGILLILPVTYLMFRKHHFGILENSWFLILFAVTFILKQFNAGRGILGVGLRILLFSLVTSAIFNRYTAHNEEQNVLALSQQLTDRADPILESTFAEVEKKIKNDGRIRSLVTYLPGSGIELEKTLRRRYFTGYFEKYDLKLVMFDSLCMPEFRNSEPILGNNDYFEEQIADPLTIPTISEDLFFIEGHKPNSRYIGKMEFGKNGSAKARHILYVFIEPKKFANTGSFPELLLDRSQQKQSQYPYAIYKNNKLVSGFGEPDHPLYFLSKEKFESINPGFRHHFIEQNGELIILSTAMRDFRYYFTTNSYYFLFYSFIGLLIIFAYYLISDKKGLFFSLNRRIQLFIVSILFFALSAVGIFSVKLVAKKFEEDGVKQLAESASRINNELSATLFSADKLDAGNKVYAEALLKKYAGLFNTDITLYDKNGYLYVSSRPQLFDLGFSSAYINPLALSDFKRNQASYFSTRDNIGSLSYRSLYTMVYNPSGGLLGYINLPYFSRQNDLEKELSDYLTTLLNVYVVLFLVSLFTGLIVTAYITKPLRIVQEQIAKISFNKKNESIQWESNDEIGKLVNEYNQMLLKLEESAILLARSEREGAWREMAKQVAHEIKNPLTPMKLNLQYLQRIVGENSIDFADKFKGVSSSIIEQIDTLAHIASEFSNFAKMPKVVLEKINLNEVIYSSIQLFRNEEGVNISFTSFADNVLITADKEQSLRVFNNLIKNSIQAIPENKKGQIDISVKDDGDHAIINIKDNGGGISEEMRSKIFVPNFTTKTTGTGLGLAMVKNIIHSFNGEIWFESKENEGTVFYIKLKKTKAE